MIASSLATVVRDAVKMAYLGIDSGGGYARRLARKEARAFVPQFDLRSESRNRKHVFLNGASARGPERWPYFETTAGSKVTANLILP